MWTIELNLDEKITNPSAWKIDTQFGMIIRNIRKIGRPVKDHCVVVGFDNTEPEAHEKCKRLKKQLLDLSIDR